MPTPVEHYEQAENLLTQADQAHDPLHAQRLAMRAGVHAKLAAVPWGQDDRGLEEVALGLDGEQVAALIAVVEELRTWAQTPPTFPAGEDAEAWVVGYEEARRRIGILIDPIVREVLDR